MVEEMEHYLLDLMHLKEHYEKLDQTQKLAISEMIHNTGNTLQPRSFLAKYARLPDTGKNWSGYHCHTPNWRFIVPSGQTVPSDVSALLMKFVPEPPQFVLQTCQKLPPHIELQEKEYVWQKDDDGILVSTRGAFYKIPRKEPDVKVHTRQIKLTERQNMQAARQDLYTVLRLIDRSKLQISEKTFRPTLNTTTEISAYLTGGDFYSDTADNGDEETNIGSIKAYAWPLLMKTSGLVQLNGKKLALTKEGLRALDLPWYETIKKIWDKWILNSTFDEFNRIDFIKGQSGKGKHSMSSVEPRRVTILQALKECPVNRWLKVEELSRFMQAHDYNFEITYQPWDLYISDSQYGSLGYSGSHDWNILQDRYILCFLFEYAATLGLVDVGYIHPEGARKDFRSMWGTGEYCFLSRYDGLIYFRINDLGAYCLGLSDSKFADHLDGAAFGAVTDKTSSDQRRTPSPLTVLPNLQITMLEESITPDAELLLDSYAEREAKNVWRLSQEKAVAALSRGHRISRLKNFLETKDDQPLPETVEGFLKKVERQSCSLRNRGTATIIECYDAEIADLIAGHLLTKSLCQRTGKQGLGCL